MGLLVRNHEVLLLRRERDPYAGLWSLPGGKAEEGEGLEAACVRELREELGWDVTIEGLSLIVDETLEGAGRWLLAIFRCRTAEELPPGPGCAWFPLAGLDGLEMIPTDRLFIADALAATGGTVPVRYAQVAPGPRLLSYG